MATTACDQQFAQQQAAANRATPEATLETRTQPQDREAQRAIAIEAVDSFLVAYKSAVLNGTGRPDRDLWQQAVTSAGRLGETYAPRIQEYAEDIVDVSLGFDFQHPQGAALAEVGCYTDSTAYLQGNIRVEDNAPQAAQLLEAARVAFHDAAVARDVSLVAAPIGEFFRAYPEYHPMHTGRCYPHGHAAYASTVARPENCITKELSGFVSSLMFDPPSQEPSGNGLDSVNRPAGGGVCYCYLQEECPTIYHCHYGTGCTLAGKYDGVCKAFWFEL